MGIVAKNHPDRKIEIAIKAYIATGHEVLPTVNTVKPV